MTFKDRALPLIALGIPVIPVQPQAKHTYCTGPISRGSTDPQQILQWDRENPNYNVGSLGTPDGIALFDCDEPNLVSRIQNETGQKFPRTFAVKSINGGGHLYFRQTERSRKLGNKAGEGVFELRGNNEYVIGPGSVAQNDQGELREYKIAVDAPFADIPDWLCDWIEANAGKKTSSTGKLDVDSYTRLRKAYYENLDVKDLLKFPTEGPDKLFIESVHPTISALAGLLREEWRTEEEMVEAIEDVIEKYGHRDARPGVNSSLSEVESAVVWAMKKPSHGATLPEGHPALEQLSDGLQLFGTKEEYEAHMKEKLFREHEAAKAAPQPTEPELTEDPVYPLEVWRGTDYANFAEICSQDNYIPKEFLIEALKTVTGAVVGHQISAPDIEGCIPRFYTVLMGGAGSGKGTSISWATSVFKDVTVEGLKMVNLIWSPATKIQDVPWSELGTCEEGFNSAPGMQRSNEKGQTRWLQTFEELDHLIEGSGIEGSGKSLMGVNRQLYDREDFSTTTTGKRDAIAGKAQNTILAATTPELWSDMFAGKQVRGSGLFQRFNLLASKENRRKGTLRRPKLDAFKTEFISRILLLEKKPLVLKVDDGAISVMDEWFTQAKFDELDGEVRGRLNVLAWRNALHLAWQREKGTIDVDAILNAIKLSEYQLSMRLRHTPAEGEDMTALVENKIYNYVKSHKAITLRDTIRNLNLKRYGRKRIENAVLNLEKSGEIKQDPNGKSNILRWLE